MLTSLLTLLFLLQSQTIAPKNAQYFQTECFSLVDMDVSDQYIALLMKYPPYVKVFNSGGEGLYQWGTRGQGPSDFTTVRDICLVGDEIWVLNLMPNRVSQFSLDGSFKRLVNLEKIFWLVRLEARDGKPLVEGGPWNSQKHMLYVLEDQTIKEVAQLTRGPLVQVKTKSGPAMNFELAFSERNFWDILHGKSIVMSTKDKIVSVGVNQAAWRIDSKTFKVPKKSQTDWLKRALPGVDLERVGSSELVEKLMALPFPKVFPPVLELMADGGRLWVLRAFRENDQLWECYERGIKINELALPCGYKVLRFHGNRVFALNFDDANFPLMVSSF